MTTPSFHLYLDSGDLAELRAQLPHPLVHGVTTNPTLLRRAGVRLAAVPDLLRELVALGAKQVMAQVTSQECDRMIAEARQLAARMEPGRVVVKIPATREGFRAGARLAADGTPVTYTAVYAPEQVLFAAQLGAAYAAPYLGRLQDAGVDALAALADMQRQVTLRESGLRILVASVRNRDAFRAALAVGVGAATISPKLFGELLENESTLAAERTFLADADSLR